MRTAATSTERPRARARRAAAAGLLALSAAAGAAPWDWPLPAWVPRPPVPADNPMSAAKVTLGRHLFFDTRLSIDGSMACASCHVPARAFTDARARAVGATGELHPRNSMGLANVAYFPVLTWADPGMTRLEDQARVPMFGRHPVEMGLAGREAALERLLARDPRYERLFRAAFDDDDPYTIANLTRALAAYQRTLLSFDAPYDRYRYGGRRDAIGPAARRGEALFFSERLGCFHCHGGVLFTDSVQHERLERPEVAFHNTGLYNLDGRGAYPAGNQGLKEKTGRASDMGRFRTPSLRNVALTAPYMHDGSIATLGEVIDHYAAGGRTIASGPLRGVGAANPYKSGFVRGFRLGAREKADLIAFLESLTDHAFVAERAHRDPHAADGPAADAFRRGVR
ncbi:MAG: di-heme enzyme [Burkholderiales bacterium]|nr:di-heme enzyme [Burkholderiales bacterium]